jgi:lipase ATG15
MTSNKNLILLALVLIIAPAPTESIQFPFFSNPQPSSPSAASSSSVFQLQQAVHITTYQDRRLHLRRIFNDTDRDTIDIRSNLSPLTTTRTDGNPNARYYPSSHSLKFRKGKIWTHHATLNQWKLAHQRQILIDRSLRNLEDHHSQLLLNNNITLMNSQLDWDEFETVLPDVTDIETLASLAMMTNNAYTLPGDDRWYDPGGAWNLVSTCNPLISVFLGINGNLPFFPTYLSLPFVQSDSFGWEEDGLRGHVFATPDNSTVVIAIKGTSAGLLGNGGSTGVNDKLNVRAHHPEKKNQRYPSLVFTMC